MDSQLNENVKKYSRATLIATLTNVVVALARKYFSILLLVLSIVKLIFTIRDKKRA